MPQLFAGIHLYQNPAENRKIMLQFIHQEAGKYFIKIFNSAGQILLKKEMFHSGGNSLQTFDLENDPHQILYLQITNIKGEKKILKLLK
jgi:hypothetical protein